MKRLLLLLGAATACASPLPVEDEGPEVVTLTQALTAVPQLGGHLPGITHKDFSEAAKAFADEEDVSDGVGPVFNDISCGACHVSGGLGGAGTHLVQRFGYYGNSGFDPLASMGGSLQQSETIGDWINPQGVQCEVPYETIPQQATLKAKRLTTPLFGLGLVDAMPDSFFVNVAKQQHPGVRGQVNWVQVLLPDPHDRKQSIGSWRVGRFGWKAGVPSLVQFSADAYLNEMGITTQSCIRGVSVEAFATESTVNGKVIPPECEDGLPGTDEIVGPCDNDLTELQEDIEEFADFMTYLAPPPHKPTYVGAELFEQVGCADCHLNTAFKTPAKTINGVPANYAFYPYSDFLRHDMGTLGDHIGNQGDTWTATQYMRTAPLWGIRYRKLLLHDGRTSDIATAILAHDGQGASAANRFSRLCKADKQQLVSYVKSL
jgi:CxxC motif-containing protein (DUF1111 family)